MKTSWWVRFSVLVVFIVFAILILLPTVTKIDENGHYPFKSKIMRRRYSPEITHLQGKKL